MKTYLTKRFDSMGKNEWWWSFENGTREHGPFESKAEAEDAAGAAKITAEAEAARGRNP